MFRFHDCSRSKRITLTLAMRMSWSTRTANLGKSVDSYARHIASTCRDTKQGGQCRASLPYGDSHTPVSINFCRANREITISLCIHRNNNLSGENTILLSKCLSRNILAISRNSVTRWVKIINSVVASSEACYNFQWLNSNRKQIIQTTKPKSDIFGERLYNMYTYIHICSNILQETTDDPPSTWIVALDYD